MRLRRLEFIEGCVQQIRGFELVMAIVGERERVELPCGVAAFWHIASSRKSKQRGSSGFPVAWEQIEDYISMSSERLRAVSLRELRPDPAIGKSSCGSSARWEVEATTVAPLVP